MSLGSQGGGATSTRCRAGLLDSSSQDAKNMQWISKILSYRIGDTDTWITEIDNIANKKKKDHAVVPRRFSSSRAISSASPDVSGSQNACKSRC